MRVSLFGTLILTCSFPLFMPEAVFAYGGPGAGLELLPYFLGLLAWLGLAFSSIMLRPLYAVIRFFRGKKENTAAVEISEADLVSSDGPEALGNSQSN